MLFGSSARCGIEQRWCFPWLPTKASDDQMNMIDSKPRNRSRENTSVQHRMASLWCFDDQRGRNVTCSGGFERYLSRNALSYGSSHTSKKWALNTNKRIQQYLLPSYIAGHEHEDHLSKSVHLITLSVLSWHTSKKQALNANKTVEKHGLPLSRS